MLNQSATVFGADGGSGSLRAQPLNGQASANKTSRTRRHETGFAFFTASVGNHPQTDNQPLFFT
ncbi:MAG: hypothetical protein IT582_10840 [Opitutaceae bacterium]|nr:hypothetical protein [Opitutaceae bacterium]